MRGAGAGAELAEERSPQALLTGRCLGTVRARSLPLLAWLGGNQPSGGVRRSGRLTPGRQIAVPAPSALALGTAA